MRLGLLLVPFLANPPAALAAQSRELPELSAGIADPADVEAAWLNPAGLPAAGAVLDAAYLNRSDGVAGRASYSRSLGGNPGISFATLMLGDSARGLAAIGFAPGAFQFGAGLSYDFLQGRFGSVVGLRYEAGAFRLALASDEPFSFPRSWTLGFGATGGFITVGLDFRFAQDSSTWKVERVNVVPRLVFAPIRDFALLLGADTQVVPAWILPGFSELEIGLFARIVKWMGAYGVYRPYLANWMIGVKFE